MLADIEVPIVIVAFGSADDLVRCLTSVGAQRGAPKFGVLICENGGSAAFNLLVDALSQAGGPCGRQVEALPPLGPEFVRTMKLKLKGADAPVFVSEARSNLGFAGGINSWLRLLLPERGWRGAWILNPDTWPEPDALAELVRFAQTSGKGMVTSRIMIPGHDDIASSRGLKWEKLRARTVGVDIFAPINPPPVPGDVERRMDSPTGVSLYVTRACIDRIGLMDEAYFLYFEEFDWGILAKVNCGIGYAHNSVVPHISGSSTGTGRDRTKRSQLVVYLQNRNKIRFVRRRFPGWLPWTVLVSFLQTGEYLWYGSTTNFFTALSGLAAGLRGESGRPDHVLRPAKIESAVDAAVEGRAQA